MQVLARMQHSSLALLANQPAGTLRPHACGSYDKLSKPDLCAVHHPNAGHARHVRVLLQSPKLSRVLRQSQFAKLAVPNRTSTPLFSSQSAISSSFQPASGTPSFFTISTRCGRPPGFSQMTRARRRRRRALLSARGRMGVWGRACVRVCVCVHNVGCAVCGRADLLCARAYAILCACGCVCKIACGGVHVRARVCECTRSRAYRPRSSRYYLH